MTPYGPAATQIKICGFPNVCQILLETTLATTLHGWYQFPAEIEGEEGKTENNFQPKYI